MSKINGNINFKKTISKINFNFNFNFNININLNINVKNQIESLKFKKLNFLLVIAT